MEAAQKPVLACMFWRLLLRTIAMFAFGYAGETGVLRQELASSLAWAVDSTPSRIFMSEAGGVPCECSQTFKEAFKQETSAGSCAVDMQIPTASTNRCCLH